MRESTFDAANHLYHQIVAYIAEHEVAPSTRNICALLGTSSTAVASYYLEILASWHWIAWTPGAARTLRLTRPTENIYYVYINPERGEETMSDKLCVIEGCNQPRWAGPQGDKYLTMCQEHQLEYWRTKKAGRPPETERTCTACGQTFPLTEEHFYLRKERGTFRRQCKACYDKRQASRPHKPQLQRNNRQPLTATVRVSSVTEEATLEGEMVEVLVVDRTHDEVFCIEVPKHDKLGKPLSQARNAEQLIALYRRSGHVVVEV
ncbi:MAG TPA: hypothetical protein VHO69_11275 [Phototrophicaceae bacterium]|nr:hypothetical protein [Phototrophicaceae bacterium]